jgi:hypothetical protein
MEAIRSIPAWLRADLVPTQLPVLRTRYAATLRSGLLHDQQAVPP